MVSLTPAPVTAIPALTHYDARPVGKIVSVTQAPRPDMKPNGLWVSVDADGEGWPEWCQAEGWRVEHLTTAHDVTLAAAARILLIADTATFDAFAAEYGVPLRPRAIPYFEWIDWQRVAAAYQGIVIAPCRYDRRFDGGLWYFDGGLWYYGWDCASGCIWDADAIAAITVRTSAREVA